MSLISTMSGYARSTDYRQLAQLARQQSIVCEVTYPSPGQPGTLRDVARTLFRTLDGEEVFEIGARGTGYLYAIGEDDFVRHCAASGVVFFPPNNVLNERAEAIERICQSRGDALADIQRWAKAYPLSVFPEMSDEDWKRASDVLAGAGLSLDRISASNMRHVLEKLPPIAAAALAEE